MIFLIVLTSVTFSYGFNCPPCDCFNNLLYCQGLGVQNFPTLPSDMKVQLKRIEIVDTLISCMPVIKENEYINLIHFIEEQNRIFNCSCLTSWFTHLPLNTIIKSNCSQNERSSTPSHSPSYYNPPATTYPQVSSYTSSYLTNNSMSPIITHSPSPYVNTTTIVNSSDSMGARGVILPCSLLLVLLLTVLLIGCFLKHKGCCISVFNNRQRNLIEDRFEFELSEDEIIFEQLYSVV